MNQPQLKPCVWHRLLCDKCGQCYVAFAMKTNSVACPQCHRLIALEFICIGQTTAVLPHFGPMQTWSVSGTGRVLNPMDWVGNSAVTPKEYSNFRDSEYEIQHMRAEVYMRPEKEIRL